MGFDCGGADGAEERAVAFAAEGFDCGGGESNAVGKEMGVAGREDGKGEGEVKGWGEGFEDAAAGLLGISGMDWGRLVEERGKEERGTDWNDFAADAVAGDEAYAEGSAGHRELVDGGRTRLRNYFERTLSANGVGRVQALDSNGAESK